ncbi:MAG TPA: SMC-Scp complex subunit ScpB [Phycisphaerales bacterium]|nr:SMC-Scp complex subunit ScpB [Phycisphaerales bacterium]
MKPEQNDQPCANAPLGERIEALLFSSDRPLSEGRLADMIGLPAKGATKLVATAIEALNQEYEQSQRAFRAYRLAGGWQLMTLPAFGPLLAKLHADKQMSRLSQPALETLAIIAYRQPILRAELEAIRGVACGEILRSLMERRLVKIVGRAEEIGRPMLYGTTGEFLKTFGLASTDDLPDVKGLSQKKASDKPTTSDSATASTEEKQALTPEPSTVPVDASDQGDSETPEDNGET